MFVQTQHTLSYKIFCVAIWASLLISPYFVKAQSSTWNMSADTSSILIGEQINVLLRASTPSESDVLWPDLLDSLNAAEIIKRSGVDTVQLNTETLLEERITVTLWDTGYYVLEPLPLVIDGDTVYSDPIFLSVQGVDDLQENPFDIKEPISAPKTLGEWLQELWPWVLAGLVLLFAIRWWRNRPKKHTEEVDLGPKIDPYEQALNQLGELLENKLWQKGEVKEYFDQLTDIARRYLELGHQIPALERTTDETASLLKATPINSEVQLDFIALMKEADQVKFAKQKYRDEDCERAYRRAKSFIDSVHSTLVEPAKTSKS